MAVIGARASASDSLRAICLVYSINHWADLGRRPKEMANGTQAVLIPADDPEVTEQMWTEAARIHFRGSVIVGKDLLEL
jgi:hypothetical protein